MNKRWIVLVLAFAMLIPTSAFAAPKAGSVCSKAGSTSTLAGKKYTCIKNGKKLVWSKGVAVVTKTTPIAAPSPTPTATQKPEEPVVQIPNVTPIRAINWEYLAADEVLATPKTQVSNPAAFANLATCKIVEGAPWNPGVSTGFSIPSGRVNLLNSPRIQIIPVDFSDVVASASPESDFASMKKAMTDFYSSAATKKINMQWQIPQKYIRMPNPLTDYDVGGYFFNKTWDPVKYDKFLGEVFKHVDTYIDFTNVSAVIVISPPSTPMSKMGTFMVWPLSPGEEFITQEGKISNVLGRGGDDITELTYVHEFGHALGLSDTRNVADVSNQKSDGMGIFDVMAAPMSPELTFWHRFMLGILNDDQTHCITSKEESIHWVRPVAMKTNGVKGVVIPLTENTGIAIESRRRLGFDNLLGLQSSGTLVYTIDTRITHPYSAYKLVPPARSTDREWERDTPLKVNESVTTNGWKITVLESGSFGDVVKVENVGGELATKAPVSKPRAISPGCNNRCGAKPNLVAPEFVSNEWNGNVYKLVLKVASIAQGAFIEIKDLLLGAEQTKTPKDASGNVTIQVTIPQEKLGRIFPLYIYTYQGEYQSQCCSSWELQTPKP